MLQTPCTVSQCILLHHCSSIKAAASIQMALHNRTTVAALVVHAVTQLCFLKRKKGKLMILTWYAVNCCLIAYDDCAFVSQHDGHGGSLLLSFVLNIIFSNSHFYFIDFIWNEWKFYLEHKVNCLLDVIQYCIPCKCQICSSLNILFIDWFYFWLWDRKYISGVFILVCL